MSVESALREASTVTDVQGEAGLAGQDAGSDSAEGRAEIRREDRPEDRPVFLVGAERSGTTLLRLMLAHHPQIAWASEFEYAVDHLPAAGGFPDKPTFDQAVERQRVFVDTGYTLDEALDVPGQVRDFLRQCVDAKTTQTGGQRPAVVGATCHRNYERLLRVWPEATFIHIVRDPRDVARSCIGMGWNGNVWAAADRWLHAEQLWDAAARDLGTQRWIELRFEDLIAEPEEQLGRLCRFMGLAYHTAMLDYDQTTTYDKPDRKIVQHWRTKLSESQVQRVEARVGDWLRRRRYEPSGLPAVKVGGLEQCRLRLQDRWSRMQTRRARYGTALWLKEIVARRAGLTRMRDGLLRQQFAIDTAQVK